MSDLARAIDSLAGTVVLCVGDVMLDRFVYGTVERISPEAPIPVLREHRTTTMLGGAGNVTTNLAALGCDSRFVAVTGSDEAGSGILRLLVEQGLADGCHMITQRDRLTSVKTRFMASNQQLLRLDSETVAPVDEVTASKLIHAVSHALSEATCVTLSDYGKGVLTPAVTEAIITAARQAGRPVVVDPKDTDFRRYRGAAVLTPNRRELSEAARLPTGTDDEVVAAAQRIIETCGIGAIVTTRSEEGLSLVAADGLVLHQPAQAREVFDVSGAGDTVVAVLAAGLGAGLALPDAARIANLAAGIVVGKVGTAVVRGAELLAALHHEEWRLGETKVASLTSAFDFVERWRRRGQRIGFTNGCFDLLHPGHVSLLTQARATCDRLVVGLNSDESVRRLKGEHRPVQSEAARAAVLASLSTVDLVVIFGEDTPYNLIRALRPDTLVKGADYTVDQVVGADIVTAQGGRVVLADLAPGHSTTATIARLSQA